MLVSLRCQSSLRISLVSPEPVLPATYGPLAPSCGGAASSATFWTPIGIRRGASSTFPKILPGEIAVDCRCEGVGCGPRTLTPDSFQQTVGKALGSKEEGHVFHAALGNFGHLRWPPNYLGGSVDLGAGFGAVLVAGFGVVPVAAGLAAGLLVVPEEVGAGTPDCAL